MLSKHHSKKRTRTMLTEEREEGKEEDKGEDKEENKKKESLESSQADHVKTKRYKTNKTNNKAKSKTNNKTNNLASTTTTTPAIKSAINLNPNPNSNPTTPCSCATSQQHDVAEQSPLHSTTPQQRLGILLQHFFYKDILPLIISYMSFEGCLWYYFCNIGSNGSNYGQFYHNPLVMCVPKHLPGQVWVYNSHSEKILMFDSTSGQFLQQRWVWGINSPSVDYELQKQKDAYNGSKHQPGRSVAYVRATAQHVIVGCHGFEQVIYVLDPNDFKKEKVIWVDGACDFDNQDRLIVANGESNNMIRISQVAFRDGDSLQYGLGLFAVQKLGSLWAFFHIPSCLSIVVNICSDGAALKLLKYSKTTRMYDKKILPRYVTTELLVDINTIKSKNVQPPNDSNNGNNSKHNEFLVACGHATSPKPVIYIFQAPNQLHIVTLVRKDSKNSKDNKDNKDSKDNGGDGDNKDNKDNKETVEDQYKQMNLEEKPNAMHIELNAFNMQAETEHWGVEFITTELVSLPSKETETGLPPRYRDMIIAQNNSIWLCSDTEIHCIS